jgi:hypothetical protein
MLYSEIIAVYFHPQKTHKYTVVRTYRAVNTLRLGYKNQSVNAVQWNNRCLFSDFLRLTGTEDIPLPVESINRTYKPLINVALITCVHGCLV